MNLLLLIIFSLASLSAAGLYFFGREKFSPAWLLASVWCAALAVSELHLSPLEQQFSWQLWLALALFFAFFAVTYALIRLAAGNKPTSDSKLSRANSRLIPLVIGLMALGSIIANLYIFWRFGTLPVLSSIPDKMRFIINKEIFGLWEWLALLPRLFIPLAFLELVLDRQ